MKDSKNYGDGHDGYAFFVTQNFGIKDIKFRGRGQSKYGLKFCDGVIKLPCFYAVFKIIRLKAHFDNFIDAKFASTLLWWILFVLLLLSFSDFQNAPVRQNDLYPCAVQLPGSIL